MFQAANTLFKHGRNFGAKIKSKQYLLTKLKSIINPPYSKDKIFNKTLVIKNLKTLGNYEKVIEIEGEDMPKTTISL